MKRVLLTGASRGIGKAIAISLLEKGHQVGLIARNQKDLEAIAEKYSELAMVLVVDVADEAAVKNAVANYIDQFGGVDVLINNAGFGIFREAGEITASEWTDVMNVNVKGTFLFSNAVLATMKAQGAGHIVGIASDVSKRTFANGSLYCASKYAQDAFLSALRKEVRKDGIKVSVVYPGLVDTYFHGHETGAAKQSEYLNPQDIADSVLYILEAPKHVVVDELMIHPISQDY